MELIYWSRRQSLPNTMQFFVSFVQSPQYSAIPSPHLLFLEWVWSEKWRKSGQQRLAPTSVGASHQTTFTWYCQDRHFSALMLGTTNNQLESWEFLITLSTVLQNSGQLATPDKQPQLVRQLLWALRQGLNDALSSMHLISQCCSTILSRSPFSNWLPCCNLYWVRYYVFKSDKELQKEYRGCAYLTTMCALYITVGSCRECIVHHWW